MTNKNEIPLIISTALAANIAVDGGAILGAFIGAFCGASPFFNL